MARRLPSKVSEMAVQQEEFCIPVSLPRREHYEDDTADEQLRESVPKLRKIVLLKDAEDRRNRLEAEKAQLARQQLRRENRRGGAGLDNSRELEIADMGVTYDYEGKVLKIKRA